MKSMRKVVLVTGGSRGIGEAIVRKFASEGFDVCFSYLKSKDQAEELAKELSNGGSQFAWENNACKGLDAFERGILTVYKQEKSRSA